MVAPAANLIGKEGAGFTQLMDFFNKTRNHVAAQGVGVAQGALEMAIAHVKQRKAFGGPFPGSRGYSSSSRRWRRGQRRPAASTGGRPIPWTGEDSTLRSSPWRNGTPATRPST